jgi:hypothetical protein
VEERIYGSCAGILGSQQGPVKRGSNWIHAQLKNVTFANKEGEADRSDCGMGEL